MRRDGASSAFVIGAPAVFRHVEDAGMRILNGTEFASRAEVVVVAGHDDFDYSELRTATQAVLRGAALVGAGRDATFPMPDGPWPGTGALLAAVERALPGEPLYAGSGVAEAAPPPPDLPDISLVKPALPASAYGPRARRVLARLARQRDELDELLVYRRTLEPVISRLAAELRRRDDLTAIRRTLRGMKDATTEPDYMRCDTEFHLAVAAATQNRFLHRAQEEVRLRLNDALSLLPESETWHRRLTGEHEAIFAAIEARDPDGAEAAAELHVDNSERSVRAVVAAMTRRRR
jgi:hypothetical protein